jgi:phage terminase large subunit-like protein
VKRYEGTRLGRQELNAELLEDVEGALWTRTMIEATRLPPATPIDCERIVVAIDPAASVGEDSDETGIIVAGLASAKVEALAARRQAIANKLEIVRRCEAPNNVWRSQTTRGWLSGRPFCLGA